MAQKKAHEVDRWLTRPDAAAVIVLVYGPDRGLVSERAKKFALATGLPLDDPFTVIKLDGSETDKQEGRLGDEVRTVPMFADKRLVWVRNAGNSVSFVAEVKALLDEPPKDCLVLIEGGDLKKTAPLRGAVERSGAGMALPCYADGGRDLDGLIEEVMSSAGLRLSTDARQLLKASLGGDRMASRSELEKLALYCHGNTEVLAEDIEAVIGDVAASPADEAVDAVLTGQMERFDRFYARHISSGSPAFLLLSAALRQVHLLLLLRGQVENEGKSASAAIASARPPVFFARKAAVEASLSKWSLDRLHQAAARLQAGILKSRQNQALSDAISRQTLLALAVEARRAR
ncbi:DNA polymerase III subunit delta [Nitratireductor basaltis]|uniref:DNA polymerase III subunit delta n=1 Tax=Nitratireductor basaltis TaxID=472175 RepID=A0A084U6D6_9HYPH|nr:DNA polymerase III subunit delta [Nitratireductor basaltis]KFB08522.1 DNA polymerase III, delta subunit [Nitratireductor basaltis]